MTKKKAPKAEESVEETPAPTPPHRIVDAKSERLRATANWTPAQLKSRRSAQRRR